MTRSQLRSAGGGLPSCALIAALLLAMPATPALAQSGDWESVHQAATWVNASADHALSARSAFWFDGHWRRTGIGAEPQQLLLRPGLQFTLRNGLRIGGGYAYIATAPYGDVPIAAPTREHRGWQQLSFGHALGSSSVSHRLRWEQRWSAVWPSASSSAGAAPPSSPLWRPSSSRTPTATSEAWPGTLGSPSSGSAWRPGSLAADRAGGYAA